jgi:predicted porin
MKKLISGFLLFAASTQLMAQSSSDDYVRPSHNKLGFRERVTTTITSGAGLSFSKSGSAYGAYIAPKINYQLTEKLRLNVGFMHYNLSGSTFMPLSRTEALYNGSRSAVSGNLVMIGGDYQLNKRVMISGAVMTDVNTIAGKQNESFKAASLGIEYKTSNNSSIRVETTISNGNGNYMNSPSGGMNPLFPSNDFGRSWIR